MPPIIWTNRTVGVPLVRDFTTTGGLGPPICVDTTTNIAYYLAPGDVITRLSQFESSPYPPITGYHAFAEIVLNSSPVIGGPWGWICLAAGIPGAFAPLNSIGTVPPPASNVFFDSSAGDTFNGAKFQMAADATVTTNAGNIVFNGATPKDLLGEVKDSGGNILKMCFSHVTVEAQMTVRPLDDPVENGIIFGLVNNDTFPSNFLWAWAALMKTKIPFHNTVQTNLWGSASQLSFSSPKDYSPATTIDVFIKLKLAGDTITVDFSYDGVAQPQLLYNPLTFTSAGGKQLPNLFSSLGLRFGGYLDATLTYLKVYADFFAAKFACLGDSLTQGRFGSDYVHGWAGKLQALYTNNVLVAGAPGAQTSDWKTAAHTTCFNSMAPVRTFVMMGTNDIVNGRSLSSIETDYTALITAIQGGGTIPIVLAVPPNGNANTALFNNWLQSQGWFFIDTYTPLDDPGNPGHLLAAYDAVAISGDHIHLTDAGHDVVYNTVNNVIVAQGW